MSGLSWTSRLYVTAVTCAGILACAAAVPYVRSWAYVTALAALLVACSSLSTIGVRVRVSLGFVISVAAIFLVGAPGATLVCAASILDYEKERIPLIRRAFNGAQISLAGGAGGLVYWALSGPVGHFRTGDFPRILFIAMIVAAAYCLVNFGLVCGVIHMDKGAPFFSVLLGSVSWVTAAYLAYGLLSLLLAVMWEDVGPLGAVLFLLPLFVARATFLQYGAQQEAYEGTLRALIQAVETKDHYTRGHSERVAKASVLIARELGMREDRVEVLRYAGMLHDVGKTGVPTRVLQKAGRLDNAESEAIREHTVRGYELLRDIDFLNEALSGIYHHHERMDGTGYPLGLAGRDIPEFARVIAVADAFDSMTSTRSYRPAMSVEGAVDELERNKGSQFDPAFVDALVRAVDRHGWQASPEPFRPTPAQAPDVPAAIEAAYVLEHDG